MGAPLCHTGRKYRLPDVGAFRYVAGVELNA